MKIPCFLIASIFCCVALASSGDSINSKISIGAGYKTFVLDGGFSNLNPNYFQDIKNGKAKSLDLILEYKFNKYIGLVSGLSYVQRKYRYLIEYIYFEIDWPASSFIPRYSAATYDISASYLEIPLGFQLTIPIKKAGFQFAPGLTYMRLLNNETTGDLRYMDTSELHPYSDSVGASPHKLNDNNLSVFFASSFFFKVTPRFRLQLDGKVNMQVTRDQLPYFTNRAAFISAGYGFTMYYSL